eukprot:scaffold248988_cov26-Tisochrysis_lutea.AAC.1
MRRRGTDDGALESAAVAAAICYRGVEGHMVGGARAGAGDGNPTSSNGEDQSQSSPEPGPDEIALLCSM